MESVEIVVYLIVAIVIGGMMITFLTSWDIRQTYHNIKDAIKGDDTVGYEEVDKPELVSAALRLWESCGYGEIDKSVAVLLKDDDPAKAPLDSAYVLDIAKKLNIERSINAQTLDIKGPIPTDKPRVVRIMCDSATQKLVISG